MTILCVVRTSVLCALVTVAVFSPPAVADSHAVPSMLAAGEPFFQQQALTEPGAGEFGYSVALSANGKTALIGAPGQGAWVFTRSGSSWSFQQQLTPPTHGPGRVLSVSEVGWSVALSANGNTALVGGPEDGVIAGSFAPGAVWVFVRNGARWSFQQKLTAPTHGKNKVLHANAGLGWSVALSGGGNTALVGGPEDNSNGLSTIGVGAAWVFVRHHGKWSVQRKLTPPTLGSPKALDIDARFGESVALSAAGNIGLVGGPGSGGYGVGLGAALVFDRHGSRWIDRYKLTPPTSGPNRAIGLPGFGYSVALAGDGNTALVGGPGDNNGVGAVWVFGNPGNKLTAPTTGADKEILTPYGASFGASVAMSFDGNTALIDAPADNFDAGAAWVFSRPPFGSWSSQKLTGSGAAGFGNYISGNPTGLDVALSGNGDTALFGNPYNGDYRGMAWLFAAHCAPPVICPVAGPLPGL